MIPAFGAMFATGGVLLIVSGAMALYATEGQTRATSYEGVAKERRTRRQRAWAVFTASAALFIGGSWMAVFA